MSVDTNTKGKNLSPYHKARHGDLEILVAPQLRGMVTVMRISTKRGIRKGLRVELSDGSASCEI